MNPPDQLKGLQYLSQTHRNEFNERRKCEYKVLLSLLTFFVLCAVSTLSDKIKIPNDSLLFIRFIWIIFSLTAIIFSKYLIDLHSANNINKKIAEISEGKIADILEISSKKNEDFLPLSDKIKKHLQILLWKDVLNPRSKRRGLWACRTQVLMVWLFAISAAFLLTV